MQIRDRYPRTMQQAFGPYTSNEINDQDDSDYSAAWWVAMLVVSSVAIGLIFY